MAWSECETIETGLLIIIPSLKTFSTEHLSYWGNGTHCNVGWMHACMLPAMYLLRVVKAMLIELLEPFWSLQQFRWFVCLFSWKSCVKHRFLLLSQGTRISCILGPIPMHRAQKCFFITTVLSSVLHGMTNKWDYFLWCNNIFF